MKNDSLRAKIINRNKGVTSLRDYAEGWNFRLDFMQGQIAGTSETSDPIDINALTLAVDDTAEPSPL